MKRKHTPHYMIVLLVMMAALGGTCMHVDHVGTLVRKLVDRPLGCHMVLLTTAPHSPLFSAILRSLDVGVVVVASTIAFDNHLPVHLWGDSTITCRSLILHLEDASSSEMYVDVSDNDVRRATKNGSSIIDISSNNNNNNNNNDDDDNYNYNNNSNAINLALSLLERAGLWKLPETRVVVLGTKTAGKAILLHHSFRNTIHGIYLAPLELSMSPLSFVTHARNHLHHSVTAFSSYYSDVIVYSRCPFCKNGREDVRFFLKINISTPILEDSSPIIKKDNLQHFGGHQMSIVSVSHFPYVDYTLDTDLPGSTVTLKDSVDARLITSLSKKLNFTYIVREEPERAFGLPKGGRFDGIMGQLQREEADFSTLTGPTPSRIKVMDYVHSYPPDIMTITSLKPSFLPQHLAMVRPFSEEVWLSITIGVLVWGVILWLLNLAGGQIAGVQNVAFSTSLLYGWGTLVERPPTAEPSATMSGQVLVGWWLVFCLIICTGFKSSLIAHLTVQGTSKPMETLEDLVEADGWRWGIAPWLLKGIPREYFSKHNDSVVKKVYKNMEEMNADLALKEIKKGRFSLFHFERYITIMIASYYTDNLGQTPYFISKKGISLSTTFGWSFRIGAPYTVRFRLAMHYLEDTGITKYWLQDVMAKRIKRNRETTKKEITDGRMETLYDDREVVLGLQHLQGAFYVLFLGSGIAALMLIIEINVSSKQQNV